MSDVEVPARGGPNKLKPSDVLKDKDSDDSDKIATIRIHLQAEAQLDHGQLLRTE
jgi:hypothetical protein